MKSTQKLTLLFWLRKGKATKDGKALLDLRATIDGLNTKGAGITRSFLIIVHLRMA